MNKLFYLTILLVVFFLLSGLTTDDYTPLEINDQTPLWEVLKELGEPRPNHEITQLPSNASVEIGKDLITKGFSNPDEGDKSCQQSKHFVCTSCHNIEKENLDLKNTDPQARLEYAKEKGIPFLQGSTLYGAVNRSSFYNDDYEKKYGDLVIPTRNNIREAIQLCAVECSQGRRLKNWELESVLAFLWTLEYKLEDLNLSDTDFKMLKSMLELDADQPSKEDMIAQLKSYYVAGYSAHFVEPPTDRKKGFDLTGNPENGKLVYDLSCKHCHENQRYSFFELDDTKTTFRHLKKHFKKYSRYSTYQVARYGAPGNPGKRAYMPQYTKEKMSDQQLEDLRAYIEMRAK